MGRAHHRRAADLLAAQPELVGRHAAAAGDWARAARAFLVAGEQALARFAAADAEVLLSHALEAAERSARPELLGRARSPAAGPEVRGAYRAASTTSGPPLATARRPATAARDARAARARRSRAVALGVPARECVGSCRRACGSPSRWATGGRGRPPRPARGLQSNRLRFADAVELGQRAVAAGRAADGPRAGPRPRRAEDRLRLPGRDRAARRGARRAGAAAAPPRRPGAAAVGGVRVRLPRDRRGRLGRGRAADRPRPWRSAAAAATLGHECWFLAHLGWLPGCRDGRRGAAARPRGGRRRRAGCRRPGSAPPRRAARRHAAGAAATPTRGRGCSRPRRGDRRSGGRRGLPAALPGPAGRGHRAPAVLPRPTRCSPGSRRRRARPGCWAPTPTSRGPGLAAPRRPERARAVLAPLLAAARRLDWIPVLVTAGLVDATRRQRWATRGAASVAARGRGPSPSGTGWPARVADALQRPRNTAPRS